VTEPARRGATPAPAAPPPATLTSGASRASGSPPATSHAGGEAGGIVSGRPLHDVRILALEQYGAGPFATAQLVDLGAEVIKVEDPSSGGDVGRSVPPYASDDSSVFFESFNRGKESIVLDLGSDAGRRVFEQLVARADVVFGNLRGDVPGRLRLRYADLSRFNARVVCCFLSSYGMDSGEQRSPGYDYVVQGRAGWMSLTGEPQGPPEKTGLSLVDYSAGLAAALAVVAGVHAARRTGRGADCDLSLFDTAIGMLSYVGAWHLTAGYLPERTAGSAHPSLVPFQTFRTADGYVVVACAKEKFWRRLTAVLGRPELADDERYAGFSARRRHAGTLLPELERRFAERTSATWLAELTAAGIPCGPVNDVAEALADPLVAERAMVVETEHPSLGTVRQLAGLVRVGEFRPVARRAPLLGEHTAQVLGELLGADASELGRLSVAGAFGGRTIVAAAGGGTPPPAVAAPAESGGEAGATGCEADRSPPTAKETAG
jgi:crotonobetainyl-CoA:carnitine CoA-transferase CaiB-like acyl-CoA transferase